MSEDRRHAHKFGQERRTEGERRTTVVIILTSVMMVIEIAAGLAFGSMALLADGLHMASHTAALGLAVFAYVYARRHAGDERFSFGTGKVNALAGFTGAVVLAGFAVIMAIESVERLLDPVTIVFNHAIVVAFAGLLVNGFSMLVLRGRHREGRPTHRHDHHDHNLRSAYLHVLADALTSLLAIFALFTGKYAGAVWLDPVMGLLGAALVFRWSWGLVKESASVLLDRQAPDHVRRAILDAVENQTGDNITDLHVWSIGPGLHSVEMAIVTSESRSPEDYKRMLPGDLGLVHVIVEVSRFGT